MNKFNKNIYTEQTSPVTVTNKKTSSPIQKKQLQKTDEKLQKKQRQLEACLLSKKINLSELQTIAWNGLPHCYRAETWKYLLDYLPLNSENTKMIISKKRQEYKDTCLIYNDLLNDPVKNMTDSEMKIYKQIQVDVPRTMTEYKLFTNEITRKMLLRILYVWSKRHPASGYVQGFNDLLTPFIAVCYSEHIKLDMDDLNNNYKEEYIFDLSSDVLLSIEADSYWCFKKMMDKIQTNYINGHPGLQHMMKKMENIIEIVDKDMIILFKKYNILFIEFSFRWMNCYLMREFSMKLIFRLWDSYFSVDDAFSCFHLYVCACLLLNFSEKIKKFTEYQEVIYFLQNLPLETWGIYEIEVLLAKAYQIYSLFGNKISEE